MEREQDFKVQMKCCSARSYLAARPLQVTFTIRQIALV